MPVGVSPDGDRPQGDLNMEAELNFADFIEEHKELIMHEWTRFALTDVGPDMNEKQALNHVSLILNRLVKDLRQTQTREEQREKSKGKKPTSEAVTSTAASRHALDRLDTGFTIQEVSAEFRALRANVVRLWQERGKENNWRLEELVRFNEAIDELWFNSISRYQEKVDQSRSWFIGILAHDLRSPLSYLTGVLELLVRSDHLAHEERDLVVRGEASIKRTYLLIDNLLELTRLHLGRGLNVDLSRVDIREVAETVLHELKMIHQGVDLDLQTKGHLVGHWDQMRINQVMTNLISNGIRHGQPNTPVTVCLEGEDKQILIKVHNEGPPIPVEVQGKLFNGFIHRARKGSVRQGGYGLGLYIVLEIAKAHQGSVEVTSTEEQGTTFTVTLPR